MEQFEDILASKVRWPTESDIPFRRAADPDRNAIIVSHEDDRTWRMVLGYHAAGVLMVKQARVSRMDRDTLVYPILFTYRHFLELAIKDVLSSFGPEVGIEPNWRSHDLSKLWESFEKVMVGFGIEDEDGSTEAVGRIVLAFAEIDAGSFSHRYPVTNRGEPIQVTYEALDLDALADVMDGVETFFIGTTDLLTELLADARRG